MNTTMIVPSDDSGESNLIRPVAPSQPRGASCPLHGTCLEIGEAKEGRLSEGRADGVARRRAYRVHSLAKASRDLESSRTALFVGRGRP